jgi:hypothetical protein
LLSVWKNIHELFNLKEGRKEKNGKEGRKEGRKEGGKAKVNSNTS